MLQFIEIFKLIVSLLPIIIELVQTIENSIPGSSNGKVKLEAVKNIISSTYQVTSNATVTFEQLWPSIQTVIGSIVTAFNATKVFSK